MLTAIRWDRGTRFSFGATMDQPSWWTGGRSRAAFPEQVRRLAPRQVDVAVCTHADADHAEGLIGLLESDEPKVSELWLPGRWTSRLEELLRRDGWFREPAEDIDATDDSDLESIGERENIAGDVHDAEARVPHLGGLVDTDLGVDGASPGDAVQKLRALQFLALSVANRESLVFASPKSDAHSGGVFTADSDMACSQHLPQFKFTRPVALTAPHHGSESNASAYTAVSRDLDPESIWVHSDGNYAKRLGPTFLDHPQQRACRGAGVPKRAALLDDSATGWTLRGPPCSCKQHAPAQSPRSPQLALASLIVATHSVSGKLNKSDSGTKRSAVDGEAPDLLTLATLRRDRMGIH